MTTSNERERIKKWIGDLMAVYFEQAGIEIMPRGQATMRKALKQAGAEPVESWCIHGEKEFPDLALEIALTAGGLSKLEIYRRFNVPQVWFWRQQALEIFALRERRRRVRSGVAEPTASGSRHRAARALRGDPFMAAGASRVSRRLRRQPLIRDAAG